MCSHVFVSTCISTTRATTPLNALSKSAFSLCAAASVEPGNIPYQSSVARGIGAGDIVKPGVVEPARSR